jgi:hypothetical protein
MTGSDVLAGVAVVSSAVVGVAGIVVPALTAGRRQARDLDRDRERHAEQQDAAREREVWDIQRGLLDEGAVTLRELNAAVAKLLPAEGMAGHIDPNTIAAFEHVGPRVVALETRLVLWFERESAVVRAWELTVGSMMAVSASLDDADVRDRTRAQAGEALDRFADAARQHLAGQASL